MADTEYGTERIGAGTQVGDFTQEFERVSLLLQGIYVGVGAAVELDALGLNLGLLSLALRLDQRTYDADAGSVVIGFISASVNFERSTTTCMFLIVEPSFRRNEVDVLIAPARAHPAFYVYPCSVKRCIEGIDDFGPFHCFHTLSIYWFKQPPPRTDFPSGRVAM